MVAHLGVPGSAYVVCCAIIWVICWSIILAPRLNKRLCYPSRRAIHHHLSDHSFRIERATLRVIVLGRVFTTYWLAKNHITAVTQSFALIEHAAVNRHQQNLQAALVERKHLLRDAMSSEVKLWSDIAHLAEHATGRKSWREP